MELACYFHYISDVDTEELFTSFAHNASFVTVLIGMDFVSIYNNSLTTRLFRSDMDGNLYGNPTALFIFIRDIVVVN
jgi:hypothetical protein